MPGRSMEGEVGRVANIISPEQHGSKEVSTKINAYLGLHDDAGGSHQDRKENYMGMVNKFYDLVTDFYEFGWGQSFHFAPRAHGESFETSIARHEMYLAYRMNIQPGQNIVDLGCGVGGPMRCIARFSGGKITGINNNGYQIKRATLHNVRSNLDSITSFIKSDFMNIPVPANTFDGAYQVEAAVHAPDQVAFYKEVFRVIKPGSYFGGFEWVMTPKYDANNADHKRIKHGIERGNSIPNLETQQHILNSMQKAGFEVIDARDLEETADIPWYNSLSGSWDLSGLLHSSVGRFLGNRALWGLETLRLAPAGSTEISNMLLATADALVEGGTTGIFTPVYFVLCRKPLSAKSD